VARAAPPAEVQKALQAEYNDRDGAVARKDIEGTLAHYAPDFLSISTAGKTHDLKEERADFLKTFRLPAKSSVTKSLIQKVTLGKAGTEALVAVHRRGILLFADPQTQLNNVLVLDGAYQDTWDKRGGAWLLTREQASSLKATMNGKPL
jgi:ketosteroid isomerase-like protein